MIDLFLDEDENEWNIFISYPDHDSNDYNLFISRLDSATEAFRWTDTTSLDDDYIEKIDESDVLIVLSGLWNKNRDLIGKHINAAQTFEKPIVIIRPYEAEEIPEELQEYATRVIGWNTACIVDAIISSFNEY